MFLRYDAKEKKIGVKLMCHEIRLLCFTVGFRGALSMLQIDLCAYFDVCLPKNATSV